MHLCWVFYWTYVVTRWSLMTFWYHEVPVPSARKHKTTAESEATHQYVAFRPSKKKIHHIDVSFALSLWKSFSEFLLFVQNLKQKESQICVFTYIARKWLFSPASDLLDSSGDSEGTNGNIQPAACSSNWDKLRLQGPWEKIMMRRSSSKSLFSCS